ncbi:voltage-gated purine nucleotide uniporter SLC17A9-like isoform X4 [Nerophis ophidion]|uniref:voltage-gated purine nucleotide uniporter SLC17A9-like isoform X4 n=1 Tax=Nerophis ophidion TaxID=159077 RepID=UPI002AE05043|nr:voltage-gated purine nucleotide uniporter SLC17A9-like isoform X4 [Nerophis ophidion]
MADEHTLGNDWINLDAPLLDRNVYTANIAKDEAEGKDQWPRAVARKWMLVLFVGTCLLYCARMTMPVCAVSMAATFHWSKIDTGLALGGFFWGYSCTQILGGHASDKIGGERVLIFSAASWAVITAATPFLAHLGSHTLTLMTMARALMGLVQGVFVPSLASLIAQRAAEGENGFLMSIIQSGSSLGILMAGGLGSLMLDLYSWESAFYAVGFLSGLWALVVWQVLLKGKSYPKQKQRKNGSHSRSFSMSYFLSLLRKPCVWAMVFAHLCTCGTSYILLSWMPTYFSEEYPHAAVWVYNVFPWLAAIPAALWGGYVSDSLISRGYSVVFVRKTMQKFPPEGLIFVNVMSDETKIELFGHNPQQYVRRRKVHCHGRLWCLCHAAGWEGFVSHGGDLDFCSYGFTLLNQLWCVCQRPGSHTIVRWCPLWFYEYVGGFHGGGDGLTNWLLD